MLKHTPQKYVTLFKRETATTVVVYAIGVEVIAPGEYILSEPRIIKVIQKNIAALPGAVISPFALPGTTILREHNHRLVSPYINEFTFNKAHYLKWYKANAPNIFA